MNTAITNIEIEIEVNFDYQPYERPTRHYPGCSEQVCINSISIHGVEVGGRLYDKLIELYEATLEAACWDEVENNRGYEIDHAEYQRGERYERP